MLSKRPEILSQTLPLERLAVYYTLPSDELVQYANPSANRLNSLLSNFEHPYDEISPRVFLGALPTYTLPHDINMVASISTYEELSYFNLPDHIKHLFLHIPDKTAIVATEDACDMVVQMRAFLKNDPNNVILIHCKQGHSRSMMMCAALLMSDPLIHDLPSDLTLEEACSVIKAKRSWTHVETDKFNKAKEIVDMLNNFSLTDNQIRQKYSSESEFCASLQGKDEIRRLREFIQFIACVTRLSSSKPELASRVQMFLDEILFSTDGKWYETLQAGTHSLQAEIRPGSEVELRFTRLVTALRELCQQTKDCRNELPRIAM